MSQEYDCFACGLCCNHFGGTLHLYPDDLERWREEKADHLIAIFTSRDAESDSRAAATGRAADGTPCSLLGPGNRCTIYETRPLVCRHFANGGSACRDLRKRNGLPVHAAA